MNANLEEATPKEMYLQFISELKKRVILVRARK